MTQTCLYVTDASREDAGRRNAGETWLRGVDVGLAAICMLTPRRPWGRPRRRRPTRRRARGTGTRTCRASGRSSTRLRGTSRITGRASACPPGTAWWKGAPSRISRQRSRGRRRTSNSARTLDPEAKCYLPGVPRITYMPYPFQIVQQADKVSILTSICAPFATST